MFAANFCASSIVCTARAIGRLSSTTRIRIIALLLKSKGSILQWAGKRDGHRATPGWSLAGCANRCDVLNEEPHGPDHSGRVVGKVTRYRRIRLGIVAKAEV